MTFVNNIRCNIKRMKTESLEDIKIVIDTELMRRNVLDEKDVGNL